MIEKRKREINALRVFLTTVSVYIYPPNCVRGVSIHIWHLWAFSHMVLPTLGFLTLCHKACSLKILHRNRGAQRLILFYFGAKPPPTTTHQGSKVEKNQSLPNSTPISMENFASSSHLTKGQKPQSRNDLQPQGFSMEYI